MTSTVRLTNPISTVDSQPDGTVLMVLRGPYNGGTGTCDEVRIVMTIDGVMDLLADLANQARHAVDDILQEVAVGRCELCNNRRLIDFENSAGNMTNRYCDCVAQKREMGRNELVNEMISVATFPMRDTHHAYEGKVSFEIEHHDG